MIRSVTSILEYCLRKSPRSLHRPALHLHVPQFEPLESRVMLTQLLLATPINVSLGAQWQFQGYADFNGDGSPDMLLSSNDSLAIWTNNGTGSFTPFATCYIGASTSKCVIGDFTGDGKPDVVVCASDEFSVRSLRLVSNPGNGSLSSNTLLIQASVQGYDLLAADFNKDGALDIAETDSLHIFLNAGSGSGFTRSDTGIAAGLIAAADFDGDGRIDIATTCFNTVRICHNASTGDFTLAAIYATDTSPAMIAAGDLNNDGKPDLVYAYLNTPQIDVRLNIGDGTFGERTIYSAPAKIGKLVLADLTGDGYPEISGTISDYHHDGIDDPNSLVVWENFGINSTSGTVTHPGTFHAAVQSPIGYGPTNLTVTDINGDGRVDVACGLQTGGNYSMNCLINRSPYMGASATFSALPYSVQAGQTLPSFTIRITDGCGHPLNVNTNVSFYAWSQSTDVPVSGTKVVKAVGGVATFTNIAILKTGLITLLAEVEDWAGFFGGMPVIMQVSPASPAALVISQIPSPLYDGESSATPLIVDVVDRFGNPTTSAYRTFALTITDPLAPANTFNQSVWASSQASFTLPAVPAGTYTLSVSTGTFATQTATLTVTHRAPDHLAIAQQPTTVYATQDFGTPIVVQVQNSLGHAVSNYQGQVSLHISSGPGFWAGGDTTVNAVDGIATFSGLSLSDVGTYSLYATAAGFSADLAPISAIPTTAVLILTQQPTNITAGALNPVSVGFVFCGAAMTTGTTPVTVAIAGGPSGGQILGTTTLNAQDGIASFNDLSFTRAGTYTLTLSAPSPWTSTTTQTFTISPGAPARLAFLYSVMQTYDDMVSSLPLQVTTYDAFNNAVTDSTSVISLTISDANHAMRGTLTASNVNGVATFDHFPTLPAGTYTLQAASDNFTSTSLATLTLVQHPPVMICTQQPSIVVAGKTFDPAITFRIQDGYHTELPPDFHEPIVISISSPNPLGLSGSGLDGTRSVYPENGIVTFDSLSIATPGLYYLKAQSAILGSSLAPAYTEAIQVVGEATQLSVSPLPSSLVAGQTIPLTVRSLDNLPAGNTAFHFTATVSIVSGPPGAALTGTTSLTTFNSVATFSDLALTTAGKYVLSVSSPDLGTLSTATVNVTPDAASSHFVVLQQPTPLAGTSGNTLQLALRDQFNNPITSKSAVSLALAPYGGAQPIDPNSLFKGAATLTSSSAGLVTFKNLTFPTAGTITLAASDAALAQPSLNIRITVAPGDTSFRTIRLPARPVFGQTLTLSTTLQSTAPRSLSFAGTLELIDQNDQLLATATLSTAGAARFTLTNLSAGLHTCRIRYAGDGNHTAVTSASFPLNIAKASSPLTLRTSTSRPVVGQPLTLSATLPAALFASRTGTIQFLDNGTVLTTLPLTSTTSTFTISTLAAGPHSFTAVFSGDDNFVATTTRPLALTIRKATPTITLAQPVINPDHSVTLSAKFTIPAPANGYPTGLVTFKAGTLTLGTCTLRSYTSSTPIAPIATLTTSLSSGTYSLTAVYSGDGSFNPATSLKLITTITSV